MTLAHLINRPCEIIRRSSDDDERDEFDPETYKPEEDRVDAVCELQQRRRDEPELQGETSESDWVLFFLPDVEIDTGDAVVVDGEVYELVGDPWEARNPRTQQFSHIEASAKHTGTEDPGS